MPNVTLRLSDEQHAELTAAAERNDRSLQREIVHRLFRAGPEPVPGSPASVGLTAERHFKPDPKPGKPRK